MFMNGKPVFAIGIVILWDGVAEGWVIASQNIFDGDFSRSQTLDGLGQSQRLILDTGPAVGDDPDRERSVRVTYFHSTLRIS